MIVAVEKVEGEKQVEAGKWGGEEKTVVNQMWMGFFPQP